MPSSRDFPQNRPRATLDASNKMTNDCSHPVEMTGIELEVMPSNWLQTPRQVAGAGGNLAAVAFDQEAKSIFESLDID